MKTNCEYCRNYAYDEEWDCYVCQVNLDEDEMPVFYRTRSMSAPIINRGTIIPLSGIRCKKVHRTKRGFCPIGGKIPFFLLLSKLKKKEWLFLMYFLHLAFIMQIKQ